MENWTMSQSGKTEKRPATLEEEVLMDKVIWGTASFDELRELVKLIDS
jgi:hypothetical protein